MSAHAIIADLERKGLRLQADGSRLHVGPKAAITDQLRNEIRAHKAELLAALRAREAERLDTDAREHFTERAAIAEFDGELSRAEAEYEAARRVFEYKLADHADGWSIMIAAPGEALAEVERSLRGRVGAERVLDVRPYEPRRAGL